MDLGGEAEDERESAERRRKGSESRGWTKVWSDKSLRRVERIETRRRSRGVRYVLPSEWGRGADFRPPVRR